MDRDSPYQGLDAFGEDDADFFFGRTRDIRLIVANVFASGLTVLYGPSGVGKTSVLQAGVVPRLRERGLDPVVLLRSWSVDPVGTLRHAIAETEAAPVTEGRRRHAVLVLDQFEDYFLGSPDDGSFASELARLVARPGRSRSVLVAVREDVVAKLDRFEGRLPGLFDNVLRLDHLDRDSGRDAIVGPRDRWNTDVDPSERFEIGAGLVDAVLDGVRAGPERVETALLQLVMTRLWDEREGTGPHELRRATFDELGGVPGIVFGHVTGALDALTPRDQELAAAILGHLVTPSRLRIAQRGGDLAGYAKVDESELRPLLERLSDDRVLRPIADVEGTDPRYEVRHESLADAVLAWRTSYVAEQQVVAERRRFQRRLLLVVVAALALAALAALVTYTWTQRQTARSEALSAEALGLLPTDPAAAVEKAVDAVGTRSIPAAEDALRTTFAQSHQRSLIGSVGGPAIRSLDVGPDGELLTTDDSESLALRTASGDVLRDFPGLPAVSDAVFCPDPGRLAVAGPEGALLVTEERRIRLGRDPAGAHSISCSRDGSRILTVSEEAVRVYTSTGRPLATIGDHESGPVEDAALSPDGALAVTVGIESGARAVRVSGGRPMDTLEGELVSVAFAPDGSRVVLGEGSGDVLIWKPGPGSAPAVLRGHSEYVRDVAFNRDGTLVASVSTDRTARLWDALGGEELAVLRGHRGIVEGAGFSADGRTLATASEDGTVRLWTAPVVSILVGHRQNVRAVAVNPDGSRVATAAEDVRVWDAATGRQVARFPARTVARLALSSDGRRVLTAHVDDGRARLWDVARPGRPIVLPARVVTSVAFTSDGRTAVTGGGSLITLYDLSGREVGRLRAPAEIEEIGRISIAPGDDRVAVSAAPEGVVAVLELGTGSELARLAEEDLQTLGLAFAPDGEHVVTAEAGGVARLWDSESGDHDPPALAGHDGAVLSASLGPGADVLLTAGTDGTARVWHVGTGAQLAALRGKSAAFASAAPILVTGGPGRTARVVRCTVCGPLAELLAEARASEG